MNQQALEAAAKAAHYAINSIGPVWDCWPDSHKDVYYKLARAALTTYAEATGERVVVENDTGKTMGFAAINEGGGVISGPFTLEPGEELVVRKAGT